MSTPDTGSIAIVVAAVSGLFAILGGFAGAWLARRTAYESWQLQNRSTVYTRFLELLAQAEREASVVLYDMELETLDKNIRVIEIYSAPLEYVRVVRLYLPRDERQRFRDLAHEYYALHTQPSLGDSRLITMGKRLDEIQSIFESTV
jgi:hypothetical protein